MKKIGICGHFGGNKTFLDGQTIKTQNLTCELVKRYGANEIVIADSFGGVKRLPILILSVIRLMFHCRNIIILPAQNGLRIFAPLCFLLNTVLHRKLHYVVIGGWLPEYISDKPSLENQLKCFSGIYVETTTMKKALESKGFQNVFVMPNFKNIHILEKDELKKTDQKPFRLCTFSRVMQEKGIDDAVNAVIGYNRQCGEVVFLLDIYGPVDKNQGEWFDALKAQFPDYISYRGTVPADCGANVLKDYYALLFPTRFFTEGIPGTILDAYAAGIPVIASKWESFFDVVEDGITGLGFEFGNQEDFILKLDYIANHAEEMNKLKCNCIRKAAEFSPEQAIQPLVRGGYLNNRIIRLCTFSRVMKEKGIGEAVEAVKIINSKIGWNEVQLDVYGQIDSRQMDWFIALQQTFTEAIRYKGSVHADRSTETLKQYTAVLFPTYYDGEGFAGTLIDAMAAGVPVIATDWKYNSEVVVEHKTGILVRPKNVDDLVIAIEKLRENTELLNDMKTACISEARKYLPEIAIQILLNNLGE